MTTARAAVADGHLERREQHVGNLTRARRHRGVVAARPRGRVADEVLEGRIDAGILQAAHVGGADRADDVRVLGDALVHASPAGVADHVEHRSQALMDAERAHRLADQPSPSPRRSSGSKDAPHARGVGNVAAFQAARPVRHSSCTIAGMPEPGLGAEASLLAPQPLRTLDRIDRAGAVHARQVADAVRASRPRTASTRPARRPSARPARRPGRPSSRPAGRSSPPASSARRARARAPRPFDSSIRRLIPSPLRSARRRCAARTG